MAEPDDLHIPRWLRGSGDLTVGRARSRVSAYLYGNILVLAAVVAASPDSVLHWSAVITVVATTLTTFLAHVVAHSIAQQLGRTGEDARLHVRDEIRDAVPIITSGAIPAVVLALGALTVLSPAWAEIIASLLLIARIALSGMQIERVSSDRTPLSVFWAGFGLAGISLVIVALKVAFTH